MFKNKVLRYGFWGLSVVALQQCSGGGNSSSSVGDSLFADGLDHVKALSSGFVPDSMKLEGLFTGDPTTTGYCALAEEVDLVECQPILLRRYYVEAAAHLTHALDVATKVGEALGDLTTSSTTKTQALTGVEGLDQVAYKKSKDALVVLGLKSATSAFLFSANGSNLKDVEILTTDATTGEEVQVELSYTDDTTWTATVFNVDTPCSDTDVRKAERVKVKVSRTGDVWTGKVMTYVPRWNFGDANPATCLTSTPSVNAQTIYYDFVGNHQATQGKVFFFDYQEPINFQEGSYQTAYGIPGACETGAVVCATTNPQNPFCNRSSTLDVSFDADSCGATSSVIASAPFGAFTDWDEPAQFFLQTVSLPSSTDL